MFQTKKWTQVLYRQKSDGNSVQGENVSNKLMNG